MDTVVGICERRSGEIPDEYQVITNGTAVVIAEDWPAFLARQTSTVIKLWVQIDKSYRSKVDNELTMIRPLPPSRSPSPPARQEPFDRASSPNRRRHTTNNVSRALIPAKGYGQALVAAGSTAQSDAADPDNVVPTAALTLFCPFKWRTTRMQLK
jgi:hypothetical protein